MTGGVPRYVCVKCGGPRVHVPAGKQRLRLRCKPCHVAEQRAWRHANPEKARAQDRRAAAAWRARNPGANNARVQAWAKANPERFKQHWRNRDARKRSGGHPILMRAYLALAELNSALMAERWT